MTSVVITMAGFGRRFLDAGYTVPKYRIVVHGRSLFAWSMLSLRSFIEQGAPFTFVVRGADQAEDFIRSEARALGIVSLGLVQLDTPTDGQATSAMLARPAIEEPRAPMLIYNIDTFVHPDALPAHAVRGAGWIPCFEAKGDAWSFAAADQQGRVTEVREKQRISRHATIGLYYFSSFERYAEIYACHYADRTRMEKGEAYVAPMYNTLIAQGDEVFIHDVPVQAVIPLGVPEEVERFRAGEAPQL
ncbi:MAG TPA: glycosyltransferase family 2 protein [Steroidobacter sp.]|uniref:glycosyltransferase family 2 protein n=1 Tax=Steroidobacter sp. TaxID=1978227 RepID=UPI002ED8DE68